MNRKEDGPAGYDCHGGQIEYRLTAEMNRWLWKRA
jgi:hypothetical protein